MINTNSAPLNKYISNETLLEQYLTPAMLSYFEKKLKNEESHHVLTKVAELLKFLALSPNAYGDIPFNNDIDEVWHLWILQTAQYQELMAKLPTKRFIHHCSNDYVDEIEKKLSDEETELSRQISYLVSYVYNFGDFSEQTIKFWPMTTSLMGALEVDLSGLNEYLFKLAYQHDKKLFSDSKAS